MQQPLNQTNQAIENEQKAQVNLVQIDLSLEAKVILAFKNKRANKLKLLDKLTRANIDLNNQLTDKTKFLHPIACTVAKRILNKLSRKGVIEVIFTHKELSEITNCLNDQNVRIIKQLGNLLEFKYHQKYLEHNHCYIFKIHPKIIEILENAKLGKGGVL